MSTACSSERIVPAAITPGFRHKVVQAPLRLANPRWVVDEDFDLAFHARRIAAPAPGLLTDVFEYACQTAMAGFDRERALWEFTLVEGLEGGRAALVMKLHHSLTDGIGGMEMAKNLFDLDSVAADLGPMPPAPDPERLSSGALVRDALGHNVKRAAGIARSGLPATLRSGIARACAIPVPRCKGGIDTVGSVARTVRPINSTLSPVMQRRRLLWHYDALTLPLDALRDAAHSAGSDGQRRVPGGVRRWAPGYHERHDAAVRELRLTMPISIRTPDDPVGGNRITLMRFKIPVGLRDPQRGCAVSTSCASMLGTSLRRRTPMRSPER